MGKRFERLSSFEALHAAAERALRGKRGRPDAGAFFGNLDRNLLALEEELRSGAYRPGPYRTFWIRDPKRRLISVAPFRDRVVHHAFVHAVEPLFEPRFIHDSYACHVGKGTHAALRRFTGWARTSRWVLKMDVAKFFPSIDHALLVDRLARVLRDPQTLDLARVLIAGSNPQEPVRRYFPGDTLLTPLERRVGLPIGNLTSQFFGNVYLDAVDHRVKDRLRVRRYLRCVDDLCAFGDDKPALVALRAEIVEALAALRLVLNDGKSRLRKVEEGIGFLGFVVGPRRLRLSSTAVRRGRRRMRALEEAYACRRASWPEVERSLAAWAEHAGQGNCAGLTTDVLGRHSFRRGA